MDWDEPKAAKSAAGPQIGEALDTLSLAELEARVTTLEGEIERVKAEIARKRAHEAAAAAIFKS